MTDVNQVVNPVALLRAQMPDVYLRKMIYDPTWNHPDYATYKEQRIVPAVGSLVKDPDGTPLWVESIDDVTLYPKYTALSVSAQNDSVVSILNWGNSDFRLYIDYRQLPYPATPDNKCIFIGKSPRRYTLSRYPGTPNETIISRYYDSTGKLVSNFSPLHALDQTNTSWYLARTNITEHLDHNEEILVKVYDEAGVEVYSAILHAKESTVINENVMYSPTIVGMTVTGNQKLADGTFFLYETQSFSSLGLQVTLLYDDGSSQQVAIDGEKCILYGQSDFISSFSGLRQSLTVKYFRSVNEAISSTLADRTGSMISTKVDVTVIPNTLGVTTKITALPTYNASLARYILRYYMYFGDGRSFVDVSAYVTMGETQLITDSSRFGVPQTVTLKIDMNKVDPTNYPISTLYQQNMVIQFNVPTQTVKWTIRDSATSLYVYGLDVSNSRRPSLRYDQTIGQYFIPSYVFSNTAAFLDSFYSKASPPYDPSIAAVPQVPTHFTVRDAASGNMIITAPIPIASYAEKFNILNDVAGQYVGATVVFEFLNIINNSTRRTLFGVPVDVSYGTYTAT